MHTDSIQWEIEVEKKDIAYIVSIFDGYENLAVVRTLDASRVRTTAKFSYPSKILTMYAISFFSTSISH